MSSYQQESINKILTELRSDQSQYLHLYNRYKKCHRVLLFLEYLCQSTNLACQSSALISLLTVAAAPVGLTFNAIGVISGGGGLFFHQLNHRKSKLMCKNKQLLKLSRHVERSIIGQYLTGNTITTTEYEIVTKLIDSYYEQKSSIENKVKL